MAQTDQELATEAAARANTAANEPRDPTKVRSSVRAAAAAARAAIPAGAGKLNEPNISAAGSAVIPQPGAARDSGSAPAAPASTERQVLLVDDKEYDELTQGQKPGEQTPPVKPGEEGAP